MAKFLAAGADGLLQCAPVSGTLKVLANTELAWPGMLDWQAIRTSFSEVAPPFGASALVAGTVLEARARPCRLDLVVEGSDHVHVVEKTGIADVEGERARIRSYDAQWRAAQTL